MVIILKQFIGFGFNFFFKLFESLLWISLVNCSWNVDGWIIQNICIQDGEKFSVIWSCWRDNFMELFPVPLDIIFEILRLSFKDHPKWHILLINAFPSTLYVHVITLYALISPIYATFAFIVTGFTYSIFIKLIPFTLSLQSSKSKWRTNVWKRLSINWRYNVWYLFSDFWNDLLCSIF